jgi:hypothetical protein
MAGPLLAVWAFSQKNVKLSPGVGNRTQNSTKEIQIVMKTGTKRTRCRDQGNKSRKKSVMTKIRWGKYVEECHVTAASVE